MHRVLAACRDHAPFVQAGVFKLGQYPKQWVNRAAIDELMELVVTAEEAAEGTAEAELAVAKKLAEWPRLVEIAARTHEPHRVAFYLYDLASDLHALWNRGNDEPSLRFLQEDDPATSQAKIALARAVTVVISAGLGILGVVPAEEMR